MVFVLRTLAHHTGPVISAAFSPDSSLLATGSFDHKVAPVDVKTGELRRLVDCHVLPVRCVAFSPDGELLATGSYDGMVTLVDTASWEVHDVLTPHAEGAQIESMAFSPDSKLLATGSGDNTAALVDISSAKVRHRLTHHAGTVYGVAFSPDGKLLATVSLDYTTALVDTASGTVVRTLRLHGDEPVSCVAFSPDGRLLATTSGANLVLTDTSSWEVRHRCTDLSGVACSIAFSPDGGVLAIGMFDDSATLVDTASARVLHKLKHRGAVYCAAISPDGKLLATGSSDHLTTLSWLGGSFWTREMHAYLPLASHDAVVALMMCARRITMPEGAAAGDGHDAGAAAISTVAALPALPVELWLMVLGMVRGEKLVPVADRR